MGKCIIKDNGYVVKELYDLTSAVLVDGSINYAPNPERLKNYRLLSNDVDFYWGTQGFKEVTLLISYKGTELVRYENPNFQLVIDYLNKFDSLSKKEIEALIVESQEKEKNELEIAIEELKAEKSTLEEQIKIYKAIQTKKEEIKALLEKLS
ncbi:hypothetical protein [Flavobacterium chungnamense]|uniref:Uncharacterized protein n=1 Tax=Flavobacterium chungnamense TaxID=706182 RepID=A0ABP7V4V8_9FLAO